MATAASVKKKLGSLSTAYNKRLQTTIVPSTKLVCVNVHKLKDLQMCNRKYFWKWVLNLEPTKLSLPLWFGTLVHVAMEYYVQHKKFSFIEKMINSESKRFKSRYALMPESDEEMALQLAMIKTIVNVYMELFRKNQVGHITKATEKRFKLLLDKTPVVFLGTIDWHGLYKDLPAIKEYKTASMVNNEYFQKLLFDKQLNGYALGYKALTGKYPKICPYTVFRKPAIRCRVNETAAQFVERLREDLHVRADWYFLQEDIRFTKHQVESVKDDIEWLVFDLFCKYETLSEEQIISPCNWPRNDDACFHYGCCEYFPLCKNISAFETYMQMYQMREIRYTEEKAELSAPINMRKRSEK